MIPTASHIYRTIVAQKAQLMIFGVDVIAREATCEHVYESTGVVYQACNLTRVHTNIIY